ncbi:MAG TPA: 4'-phosphopantetheinyl transferase superfamily protein [Bacteroidales bacterium]|nr:4'-phosphopantetheinyl transferase superfamily protein [Bacteroidales bacterium]HPT53150.1 4'-phosphopantetheinyl transferase superfamily protein [Bacteroidales bacterium]
MPIILSKNLNSSVSFCVWRISETEEFFYDSLQLLTEDENYIRHLKLPTRRLEKLACRAALASLLHNRYVEVRYNSNGVPQIPDYFVSFAHSHSHVAVAVTQNSPIGIDIEPITERITKLYTKILSQTEIERFDIAQPRQLHFCWGAKEAMYKYCGGSCPDHINHLQVLSFPEPVSFAKGVIQTETERSEVQLCYYEMENQMIVLCYNLLNNN